MQLLTAGQIDPFDLQTILDAGDLSGEHARLLGFAVAFQHLRAQGRPVNLGWSAKRWQAEAPVCWKSAIFQHVKVLLRS